MPVPPPRVGDTTNLLLKKLVTATEGISGGGGGAVDSVNGQTGVVVLDAADVGAAWDGLVTASGLTMNTGKLLGRNTAGPGAVEEITLGAGLSLAGTTLNAAGGSVPVQAQIVYVSKDGNDGTATGSLALSFLTVKAAVDSIVDSSATKGYVVMIGPGEYQESDFTLPVNVNLTGPSPVFYAGSISFPVLIKPASGILTITLATGANSLTTLGNLVLSNVAIDGVGASGQLLNLTGCSVESLALKKDLPYVAIFGGTGSIDVYAATVEYFHGSGLIVTTYDSADSATDIYVGLFWCFGTFIFASATGKTVYAQLRRCDSGNVTVTGDGTTLELDGLLRDGPITIGGGSPSFYYRPMYWQAGTPGDWAGSPPTTLQEAIDRLAAASVVPP